MLSPLLDPSDLLFEDSWELTALHQEAATLATGEFWRDIEDEVSTLPLALPANIAHSYELDHLLDWSVEALEACSNAHLDVRDKLVHHDCMWAGKCDDKLHPGNEPCHAAPATPPHTAQEETDTVQSAAPGRSLLLVQRKAPAPPPPPPRPDTPLSLDEEEPPQFRHHVDVAGTARRLLQPPPRDTVAADHSYSSLAPMTTLPLHPRDRFDNLGVQTPSDSEEEIDVETVGEKSYLGVGESVTRAVALPTNPSLLERATLQRTVASGLGSRPPAPRKRLASPPPEPPRKRARGSGGRRSRTSPAHRRRAPDSDSEPEGTDVERRSLHNDMERMRRIGLKNLFDELKAAVPSTRDKARAPKVAILREAALLCRRLQAEDREREQLRKQQQRLLARVRRLRRSMAPHYH